MRKRLYFFCWLVPFLIACAFRFYGLNWDDLHLLNPDERFLLQVTESLRIPASVQEWLDPQRSPFNPEQQGFGFYVYGTLPLLFMKIAAELFPSLPPALVGRFLNACFDLLTLSCVGGISALLWKKRKAVFASMLGYACFVAAIQQAHFFTVDLPAVFFGTLSLLFLVLLFQEQRPSRFLLLAGLTGLSLGAAMACKVSSAFFVLFPCLLIPARLLRTGSTKPWRGLPLAGLIMFLLSLAFSFRVFQPYAFQNGSLLDFTLNPNWLDALRELAAQSGGNVAFPPAWQWAERSAAYVLVNLALYGLGIPLTLFLCLGLAVATTAAARQKNIFLVVALVGSAYFMLWQLLQFSQMMRYWLPLFPLLFALAGSIFAGAFKSPAEKICRGLGIGCLLLGVVWAVAFVSIYSRPHTRVQASEWIETHVPAVVQAVIATDAANRLVQPVGTPYFDILESGGEPYLLPLHMEAGDDLQMLEFASVETISGEDCRLAADLCEDAACAAVLETAQAMPVPMTGGSAFRLFFPETASASDERTAWIGLRLSGSQCSLRLSGDPSVYLLRNQTPHYQTRNGMPPQLRENESLSLVFKAGADGFLESLELANSWRHSISSEPFSLEIRLTNYETAEVQVFPVLLAAGSADREMLTIQPPEAFPVRESAMIGVEIVNRTPDSLLMLRANRIATESTWDDALPLASSDRRPYDRSTGIYGTLLDLDLFADEDLLQRERLLSKIDAADFWVISSNRVYSAAARIGEKFPLLEPLYRQAIDCLDGTALAACFAGLTEADIDKGHFFTIRAVFLSEPSLFGLTLNTQLAEEAFTVYDHPKVIVLEKSGTFDLSEFRQPLDAVNLSAVSDKNPVEYKHMESISLMQTDAQAAIQQAGGTWSQLFDRAALINQNQVVGTIAWLLFFWLIGWVFYPLTRIVFSALRDKGYGISRLFGLLCAGLVVWLGAFAGIPYSRRSIGLVLGFWLLVNLILFLGNRKLILRELRANSRAILQSDLVFLVCFLFFLGIRLGNPDLWHPYKGGEKPMDFSYFNAVLKSTVFPPYDPWFAGGTLNYYYYGFFLSGLPVKLLGIIPSMAYNLILPTWYGFLGAGAFAAGAGIYGAARRETGGADEEFGVMRAGLSTVLLMQVLGNLGTIKIILTKLTELGAAGAEIGGLQTVIFFFTGIGKLLGGQPLPLYPGDWYWLPSRAIPGEPITEFPFFTFLYGDPHAHLFALPVTVLALVWMVAMLRRSDLVERTGFAGGIGSIAAGALIIGALIPTNTWDTPTYLLLAVALLIGTGLVKPLFRFRFGNNVRAKKVLSLVFSVLLLCGLTFLFYLPYLRTNSRETGINVWQGDRTPLWSYWMHWGLFLFAIISWYAVETVAWMRAVRYLDFRKFLREKRALLAAAGLFFVCALVFCTVRQVGIGWTALPLMVWSGLLMMRRGTPAGKKALYFLAGTGLFITLFVEFFSLRGDLGRMNMVFKLYLQAWVILSIPAAAGAVFCAERISARGDDHPVSGLAGIWQFLAVILLIGTASYPVVASADKIRDRMSTIAPHTLDGMAYMQTSQYFQDGFLMDLAEDYDAIRWMQDTVAGSPVIVEGNATEYKWGSRFTVYTGLPGVVGWNYHQRQQRGAMSDQVWRRVDAVGAFYNSADLDEKAAFLREYAVGYIIVGQMERGMYAAEGIAAFSAGDGVFWDLVYRNGDTEIYQVR